MIQRYKLLILHVVFCLWTSMLWAQTVPPLNYTLNSNESGASKSYVARNFISLLQSGRANPMELILKRHITHEADEYVNNSISAVVSKMVEAMGVHLSAGESIEFIIIDQSGKKKPEKAKPIALYAFEDGYDIEQYTELALRAVETLLLPFGYDIDTLKAYFDINQPRRKRLTERPKNQDLPLFRIEI